MREVLVALLLVACSSSEAATPRAEVDSGADAAFDSGADAALESGADAAADSGADAPGLPACPSFAEPVAAGVVDAPAITEASGIVAGSTGYWVHNDSGDSPRVFHLDAQGQLASSRGLQPQRVREGELDEDGVQGVEPVGALAEHLEEQVRLGRSPLFDRQRHGCPSAWLSIKRVLPTLAATASTAPGTATASRARFPGSTSST